MRAYGTNLFANKLTYLQTKTKGENKNKKTAMCHRTKYQKNFAAKLNIESCVNYNYASSVSGNFFESTKFTKARCKPCFCFCNLLHLFRGCLFNAGMLLAVAYLAERYYLIANRAFVLWKSNIIT